MPINVGSLKTAISHILAALEVEHDKLTELDGRIGDGDLGITLLKAFRELDRIKDELPNDIGLALMQGAAAVSKVSSSSFGNLLATCLMAIAKETRGLSEAEWTKLSGWLKISVQAMMALGKASLGDKTVMDAVDAAADAIAGLHDPTLIRSHASEAIDRTLIAFREKPNRVGRARIFAERSVGLDDPGMVAFGMMVNSQAASH